MKTQIWSHDTGPDDNFEKSRLSLGHKLFGRYEIFGVRQGGMGIVYFVEDIKNNQQLAAKTLPSLQEGKSKEDFLNEITLSLNLPSHPHIVRPLFVEFEENQPYLFMEYVNGPSLRELMGEIKRNQAINLAYQICLAMDFVTARGVKIIHADLKPENVLIAETGVAKVTDFGISKTYSFYDARFSNQTSGSLPYMPPEQLRGEVVDERSDIFSFGMLFFEMIEGRLPYPFPIPREKDEQRKVLNDYYNNMHGFSADDDRLGPWADVLDGRNRITGWDRYLISGCLFPKRTNRFRSFQEVRQVFEQKLGEELSYTPQLYNDDYSASSLHRKAISLYKIGKYNDALNVFNTALKTNPQNAELWRDAAIILVKVGNIDAASYFLNTAKQIDPNIDTLESDLSIS